RPVVLASSLRRLLAILILERLLSLQKYHHNSQTPLVYHSIPPIDNQARFSMWPGNQNCILGSRSQRHLAYRWFCSIFWYVPWYISVLVDGWVHPSKEGLFLLGPIVPLQNEGVVLRFLRTNRQQWALYALVWCCQ